MPLLKSFMINGLEKGYIEKRSISYSKLFVSVQFNFKEGPLGKAAR
jgi:hypothetical protein